ncbi:PEP-CTERM sorting domain-containing protein [Sphaerotilus sp.]|jgi:PEP-CTERM motif|uniref:PEP-CTERM sorting domain-containing protein n=1 Tax=Sphaerotilus sp. TaxID=2093942 RepID=UPI0025D759F3|nr:PEP-CTERM sorting domain-containing protein [Sphaerotilus sp.]
MHKTLTSLAAGLLLAAVGTGAHAASNLITAGDFERASVAADTFDTWSNLGGYGATLWGSDSTSGTHKIVDVAGNQSMQFGGGDSAYTSFTADTGGQFNLSFDYNGSGFWALYNQNTASYISNGPLVQISGQGTNNTSLSLTDNTSYKLYFGSVGAGLPGLNTGMTLDNVAMTAVTPVPEPESYAMLVAGLGVLGFVSRRRQQR